MFTDKQRPPGQQCFTDQIPARTITAALAETSEQKERNRGAAISITISSGSALA